MFGTIKLDSDGPINYKNNFRSFGMAMMLLFKASTFDGWQEIMLHCMPTECDPKVTIPGSDKLCGSSARLPK